MSGMWDRTLVYLGLREETDDAYDDAYEERGDPAVARFDADADPHAERAAPRPAERRPATEEEVSGARQSRTPPADRPRRVERPGTPERRPPTSTSAAARDRTAASDTGERPSDRDRGSQASERTVRRPGPVSEPTRSTPTRRDPAATSPRDPAGSDAGRPARRDPDAAGATNVARLPNSDVHVLPVPRGPSVRVPILPISAFDEVEQVGQRVRAGEAVLFDLADADATTARRVVDFVSGTVYGLHGRLERVAGRAFLVRPRGVELSAEERGRLGELGYRVPAGSDA
jgi:cell division inhibitor SepF